MAAEQANIQPGDTLAIWGCGPVGQFAIQSAWMFNPARVIAIDRFPNVWRWREHTDGLRRLITATGWMLLKP